MSGQVPAGDVRLTANINRDLHRKLKVASAVTGKTMGDLIEEYIGTQLDMVVAANTAKRNRK